MSDMRIGIDKGHNDDVFALAYNPVTDHVVAVGKKFIRFFGIKEGVEDAASESRDAKLSEHESKIWAKKGVFGKGKEKTAIQLRSQRRHFCASAAGLTTSIPLRQVPGDIMCVAFAHGGTHYDGTTFVGAADGSILRFMEQATDLSVKVRRRVHRTSADVLPERACFVLAGTPARRGRTVQGDCALV